jgi:L-malate glycosyltransferase
MKAALVFIHLLNDSSGSPRVLCSTIAALTEAGHSTKLYIGSDGNGCLSDCGIPITRYWYHRSRYRLVTLFTFFLSQGILFCKLLGDRSIDKNAVIYINTLLPFGAALYGKLTGRKVIYHVHEISVSPAPLRYWLTAIARWTSSLNLYVTRAHLQALPLAGVPAAFIHNALSADFNKIASGHGYAHRRNGCFNILMVASLRDYKGVPEYLALAAALADQPTIRFDLVVNDEQAAVDNYFSGATRPHNLAVHARTNNTAAHYGQASLVVNLSRVDQWVETFGMTILEAMAFGIPVIAPPMGGPAELMTDGEQGYLIDSRNHELLRQRVLQLSTDSHVCAAMSRAGRQRATEFSVTRFAEEIAAAINLVRK